MAFVAQRMDWNRPQPTVLRRILLGICAVFAVGTVESATLPTALAHPLAGQMDTGNGGNTPHNMIRFTFLVTTVTQNVVVGARVLLVQLDFKEEATRNLVMNEVPVINDKFNSALYGKISPSTPIDQIRRTLVVALKDAVGAEQSEGIDISLSDR